VCVVLGVAELSLILIDHMEGSIISNIMSTKERSAYLSTHDDEEPPMEEREKEKLYKILNIFYHPTNNAENYIEYARSDIKGKVLSKVKRMHYSNRLNEGIYATMITRNYNLLDSSVEAVENITN